VYRRADTHDGPRRRASDPEETRSITPRVPVRAETVLALQSTAGNAAVARLLTDTPATGPRARPLAREGLVKQGAAAVAGGGPLLAAAAFAKQSVAWANAAAHVSEKDSTGGPMGIHLGPGDALRHCTWSALVMMQALIQDSPESRAIDLLGNLVTPRLPAPSELLSVSPVAGTAWFPTARERARAVLLSHELVGNGPFAADSKMDQNNNEVGMSLAEDLFRQGKRDDGSVCAAARAALDSGRLQIFDIEGTLISSAGWRDLNADTWAPNVFLDPAAKPLPKQPRPRTRADAERAKIVNLEPLP